MMGDDLREALKWIGVFADIRSKDDAKTFARVNRAALRTIAERAHVALAAQNTRASDHVGDANDMIALIEAALNEAGIATHAAPEGSNAPPRELTLYGRVREALSFLPLAPSGGGRE